MTALPSAYAIPRTRRFYVDKLDVRGLGYDEILCYAQNDI